MTRYYFNGLTEEVKKESVGTHALTSFEFDLIEDVINSDFMLEDKGHLIEVLKNLRSNGEG